MNKNIVIVIGILVVVALGFAMLSNMTGNVITGAVVGDKEMVVDDEYFRIDGVNDSEEDLNDSLEEYQNNSK